MKMLKELMVILVMRIVFNTQLPLSSSEAAIYLAGDSHEEVRYCAALKDWCKVKQIQGVPISRKKIDLYIYTLLLQLNRFCC